MYSARRVYEDYSVFGSGYAGLGIRMQKLKLINSETIRMVGGGCGGAFNKKYILM